MFKTKTQKALASMVLGIAGMAVPRIAIAATPIKLSGVISGQVHNAIGFPQMGATVLLFNRQDRNIDKALTDSAGEFRFADLLPDLYSVKVSLAAFFPYLKRTSWCSRACRAS